MPYMISSRWHKSVGPKCVSQSKLIYSSLKFVGNKLTRIATAKLVEGLLRVARVTVGLAESNGSLQPGL